MRGVLLAVGTLLAQEGTFHLMGTYAVIELPEGKTYEAYRIMKGVEELLSDYIPESDISRVNKSSGQCVKVSELTSKAVSKALFVSNLTNGSFDPTVGSWSINFRRLGSINEDEALKLIDFKKVRLSSGFVCLEKGMALDLGGIGKGFAIEELYEMIKTPWGFVSIAGDLKVWGHQRELGVFNPLTGGLLAKGKNVKDLCMSTGSNFLRRHILGKENSVLQVTVVGKDCAIVDAIETALVAMSDSERDRFLSQNRDIGVLVLLRDGSVFVNRVFLEYFSGLSIFPNDQRSQD
ncbi:MAG: FAD:protein FMN transferase [Aquificaceae bacterium]|nr:FAD:protein FMN transferase [Aquificaceae bacterium]